MEDLVWPYWRMFDGGVKGSLVQGQPDPRGKLCAPRHGRHGSCQQCHNPTAGARLQWYYATARRLVRHSGSACTCHWGGRAIDAHVGHLVQPTFGVKPFIKIENCGLFCALHWKILNMAVPIIVGVGDVRNKSTSVQDAIEPAQLMATAIRAAAADTGLDAGAQRRLLASADALRVVPTWTWAYGDLPATVADYLGINPSTRVHDYHGGNQPALQCDEAARAIASRKSSIAILTGGEALASRKSTT